MTIDNSVRTAAWSALQDPGTTGAELAAIAAEHPEFAGAIARHPNAYPELVEWARGVVPAAPAPTAETTSAPPAETALTPRRVLGRRLWAVVPAAIVVVPVLVAIIVFTQQGELDGVVNLWLYGSRPFTLAQIVLLAVHALAAVAAALSAPALARRIGSIVLVVAAWVLTFGGSLLGFDWWPLWELLFGPTSLLPVALWGSLLFVSWAISRPLRGAGYAALPIVVIVPLLLEWLLWPYVRYWWGAGDLFQVGIRYVITLLVGTVIVPGAGIFLALVWSRASERRSRVRAHAQASVGGVPAGQGHAYGYAIAASDRTNTMAILSLVLAFVFSIPAVILGHVSLSQIRRTGEQGRGLAIAGLVLGYLGIAAGLIVAIWYIVVFAALSSSYPY